MDRTDFASEDTRITVGAALAVWGGTVAGAGASGLFEKFSLEELVALAAFATVFALVTYFLDPAVRAFVDSRRHLWVAAFVLDAGVALAYPHAATLLFALPLAAVATAAALGRLGAPQLKSARGKSPGASPAAT